MKTASYICPASCRTRGDLPCQIAISDNRGGAGVALAIALPTSAFMWLLLGQLFF